MEFLWSHFQVSGGFCSALVIVNGALLLPLQVSVSDAPEKTAANTTAFAEKLPDPNLVWQRLHSADDMAQAKKQSEEVVVESDQHEHIQNEPERQSTDVRDFETKKKEQRNGKDKEKEKVRKHNPSKKQKGKGNSQKVEPGKKRQRTDGKADVAPDETDGADGSDGLKWIGNGAKSKKAEANRKRKALEEDESETEGTDGMDGSSTKRGGKGVKSKKSRAERQEKLPHQSKENGPNGGDRTDATDGTDGTNGTKGTNGHENDPPDEPIRRTNRKAPIAPRFHEQGLCRMMGCRCSDKGSADARNHARQGENSAGEEEDEFKSSRLSVSDMDEEEEESGERTDSENEEEADVYDLPTGGTFEDADEPIPGNMKHNYELLSMKLLRVQYSYLVRFSRHLCFAGLTGKLGRSDISRLFCWESGCILTRCAHSFF
jgi:hypothetical protein